MMKLRDLLKEQKLYEGMKLPKWSECKKVTPELLEQIRSILEFKPE